MILSNLKKNASNQSFPAPVDFNSSKKMVKILNSRVSILDGSNEWEIPAHLLESCESTNLAYEATSDLSWKPLWIRKKDNTLYKLSEPNLETIVGPILEIGGTKMHVSKGYKTCFDFSKKLANAAVIKPKGNVLDLFFGLGYCTKEALSLGCKNVVAFEKSREVLDLGRMNSKFSPNLDDQRVKIHERVDLEKTTLFGILEKDGMSFDGVIIDPPKFDVLMHIYSLNFINRLSQFMKKGCLVACYVPEAARTMHKKVLDDVQTTFVKTGKFKYIDHVDPVIIRFEKQ